LCSSSKRILRNASRHCGSLLGASGIIVPTGGDVRPRYLTPWIAIPYQALRGREQAQGVDAVPQRMEVQPDFRVSSESTPRPRQGRYAYQSPSLSA
jgi:hypothetical protein